MRLLTRFFPYAFRFSAGQPFARRSFCTSFKLCHNAPEVIRLTIGGSGHVVLSIFEPPKTSKTDSNDVLIVFPAGPALQLNESAANALSTTASLIAGLSTALPSTTVIGLHYRLSSLKHPYPVPIHDTATAFTYIAKPSSPHNGGQVPKISLLGSHIGGSLALMLALTAPDLVHSLQVIEPFVDWVSLDGRKPKPKDTSAQDALAHLLTLRSRLFNSPSAYFDPFASPVLFLRAPGRDTPATHSSPLTENEDDVYSETNNDADAFGPYDDDMTTAVTNMPQKRRKVLRRWPPVRMPEDVILPYTKIILREGGGLNAILRGQGREMGDLMRKACFWGKEKSLSEERVNTEVVCEEVSGIDQVVQRAVEEQKAVGLYEMPQ